MNYCTHHRVHTSLLPLYKREGIYCHCRYKEERKDRMYRGWTKGVWFVPKESESCGIVVSCIRALQRGHPLPRIHVYNEAGCGREEVILLCFPPKDSETATTLSRLHHFTTLITPSSRPHCHTSNTNTQGTRDKEVRGYHYSVVQRAGCITGVARKMR